MVPTGTPGTSVVPDWYHRGTRSSTSPATIATRIWFPAARFAWQLHDDNNGKGDDDYELFGCRHGRVLLHSSKLFRVVVWDPITGDQRAADIPRAFRNDHDNNSIVFVQTGTVRRVGGDHSSLFDVAILGTDMHSTRVFACVYSSETSSWGNIMSTASDSGHLACRSGTLVGNSLYCLLQGGKISILQGKSGSDFPLDMPADSDYWSGCCEIAPAEDGGFVFLVGACSVLKLWKHRTNCDGVAGWML
uniref:F-box protein AT5G49610-like beta-propeller domain-containing protein n=1 Tax=Leersia perrieri TaxID=77586 RepID=A0A0D9XHP2_9ORYZ